MTTSLVPPAGEAVPRRRSVQRIVMAAVGGAALSLVAVAPSGHAAHRGYDDVDPSPSYRDAPAGRFACQPGHVPPAGFEDIAGNTHERQIECLVRYGVGRGVTQTQYVPGATVRRDQLASFIARTLTEMRIPLPPGQDRFGDVDGNVHREAIERLAAAGVVNGTSSDTYTPAAAATREQTATFLWRAFVFMRPDYGDWLAPDFFYDDDASSHERNINRAKDFALVAGKTSPSYDDEGRPYSHSPGTYGPQETLTRDQMASFIARLLDAGLFHAPGSNNNPYPLGQQTLLRDNWSVSVQGSDSDATSEVLAHNPENTPPAENHHYVIFRLRAINEGDAMSQFNGADRLQGRLPGDEDVRAAAVAAVGDFPADPERGPQSAAGSPCGDIPDALPNPSVGPGGTVEGNICFELSDDHYYEGRLPTLFDAAWGNPAWPHFKAFPAGQKTNDGRPETSPYH